MKALVNMSLPARKAKAIESTLDCETRFADRSEFVYALAALAKLYPQEMTKRNASGRTLHSILVAAAEPERSEWYFNVVRVRSKLSGAELLLAPNGTTTSNEALNLDLKRWHYGQSMHPATLGFKLRVFRMCKLLAHNSALYRQTTMQLRYTEVLSRVVGALDLWPRHVTWRAWCKKLLKDDAVTKASSTHMDALETQIRRFSKWKEAVVISQAKSQKKRRTVFTLAKKGSMFKRPAATDRKLLRKRPARRNA